MCLELGGLLHSGDSGLCPTCLRYCYAAECLFVFLHCESDAHTVATQNFCQFGQNLSNFHYSFYSQLTIHFQ